MDNYPPTSRTKIRRLPKRGSYDKLAVRYGAMVTLGIICTYINLLT